MNHNHAPNGIIIMVWKFFFETAEASTITLCRVIFLEKERGHMYSNVFERLRLIFGRAK